MDISKVEVLEKVVWLLKCMNVKITEPTPGSYTCPAPVLCP